MAQLKFGSAGVTAREIDLSGPVAQEPVGIPAGVIGTALQGPAFVPITVGLLSDFYAKFGLTDGKKFGPLAVTEWLRNAGSITYLRVLGAGDGRQRTSDGSVSSAGFTVGENQPRAVDGVLVGNPYAMSGSNSVLGRTFFLGAFMSESAGSTVFSDAGLQGQGSITPGVNTSVPIVRGVLMAASGVILRLSSSVTASAAPSSTLVANEFSSQGSHYGAVVLLDGGVAKQDFVLLLNGHKGTDPLYPNYITASFDMTSPNYFANVLNKDPLKYQQAGHYLHSHWDVHPSTAVVTGSGLLSILSGASATTAYRAGVEVSAFLTTSSLGRNAGSATVPNYEAWTDRFAHSKSPWVISQRFGGVAANLFKLHALDAGAGISTNFKLSIENIAPSSDPANRYGSFDLVVRDWNDQDNNLRNLEQWRGLNLDPNSDRYIAKIIGDAHIYYDFDQSEASQKIVVEGSYPNRSNLIRVEVSSDVDNQVVDATALPMGVRGVQHLITSGTKPLTSPSISSAALEQVTSSVGSSSVLKRVIESPLPLRKNITQGSGVKLSVNPLLYWGVRFEHVTSLTTPNASVLQDKSLLSFAKYFPDFSTTQQSFVVGDNYGEVATAENGELDSDRFCKNLFTLENIKVVTGSTGLADSAEWDQATYVRDGNITADETAKSRRLATTDFIQANRRFLKYTFFMQGGFDGVNLFDADESAINDTAVVADMNDANRGRQEGPSVRAYTKALDIMKNVVNVDIQLLAVPGIRHPIVSDTATNAVEERFDALYLMDIEQLDNNGLNVISDSQLPSVTLTVNNFRDRALDSSFSAAYFPDVVMTDPNTKTNVYAPPSVAVLGALALNDAVGHPWFAPAGFTRGSLQTVQEARVQLSKTNMDALYDVSINPLVAFPGNSTSGTNPKGGVIVWGQKTLQASASALDRVNVRRLLIDIRRQVREISQTIIFEPNRETTLAKFSAAVTPRLQRVQALAGLERFRVIIDSSTTTQADIENNTLRGKIYVQPTKTIEFVSLDFVVTNNISQG
jgi:phage tail sheath protein FI